MALSQKIIEKIGKIAVWGCGGKMGHHYMDKLLKLGIPTENLLGIDINAKNLAKAEAAYPGPTYTTRHEKALSFNPRVVVMAVNSTEHLDEIIRCYKAGITKILCEKPLVYYGWQTDRLKKYDNSRLYVAHLINFSGIIMDLLKFMNERRLVLAQFHSFWGKNWPGEKRIMGGDAEEETTHPLALALALVNYNRVIRHINVFARVSFVPHVQPEYIAEAGSLGQGFPEAMNDSTIAQFLVHTDTAGIIPVHIASSFNYTFQIRRVDLGMYTWQDATSNTSRPPKYKACLEFDINGKDVLRVINARTNEVILSSEYSGDKIQANLEAALLAYAGEDPDPRLVDFETGAWLVNLLQRVLK